MIARYFHSSNFPVRGYLCDLLRSARKSSRGKAILSATHQLESVTTDTDRPS